MFEAAQRAELGDLPYFIGTRRDELTYLVAGRDEEGRTLLHLAARNGHADLLDVLVRAGAGKVVNKADDEVRMLAAVVALGAGRRVHAEGRVCGCRRPASRPPAV